MAVVVTGYELCGYSSSVYRDSTGRSPVTVETFCVEPGANSVSFPPPLPAVHLRVPVAPPCGLLAITACSAMVAFPLPGGAGAERCDELGDEGAIPFSASKASPRVWSVSQSMGSDYERSWVKVLPVSLLCSGLLLWCVFREKTEIDDKLEALFSGEMLDPSDASPRTPSNASAL
uniref:Protein CCSMST1 n=1 Tax=Coturnix japonica TaxID=93934 RepID=A0A8C2TG83_COTJA